jgi:hypothetical protein
MLLITFRCIDNLRQLAPIVVLEVVVTRHCRSSLIPIIEIVIGNIIHFLDYHTVVIIIPKSSHTPINFKPELVLNELYSKVVVLILK